jgi:hypothetical protein
VATGLKSDLHERLGVFARELYEKEKKERGITRRKIVDLAGITESHLANIEKGDLDIDTWERVITAYGGDPVRLLQKAILEINTERVEKRADQRRSDRSYKGPERRRASGKDANSY